MLIPGFLAGDVSLIPLAAFCNWLGHRPHFGGILANANCPRWTIGRLELRLGDIYRASRAPVTLVGHSLGGLYARELAHRKPGWVERVITLAAPINAPRQACNKALGLLADSVGLLYGGWQGCLTDACTCGFKLAMSLAPPVPTTVVYSRTDGIVDWRACVDQTDSHHLDHVEVMGSHIGMMLSPDVFRIIAERLAMPRETRAGKAAPVRNLRLVHSAPAACC